MKKIALAAAFAMPFAAQAGVIDRTDQDVSVIFENGNYAEFSYAYVMPRVDGVYNVQPAPGVNIPLASGSVAPNFGQWNGAIKFDVNPNLSFALIADQPYGAHISYPATESYPLAGTNAKMDSFELTALARYRMDNGFSVYGGLNYVTADANVTIVNQGTLAYDAEIKSSSGTGYVVGAAYERPDIAMRVALTYRSEVEMSHDVVVFDAFTVKDGTKFNFPQSVTLDFQTGIAKDTLIMGKIRWVEWTETKIFGPNPLNPAAPVSLVEPGRDAMIYELGIGRRFTDKISGSLMFGYESSDGKPAANLGPADGKFSIGLGGKFQVTDNSAISVGANYTFIGDATTEAPVGGVFEDNSAFGVGVKYSFTF